MSNLGSEKVLEIRENARNAANAVLETYWPSLSIPVDPVQIARSMGLSVFRSKLDGDVWGMIIGDEGGVRIFISNTINLPLAYVSLVLMSWDIMWNINLDWSPQLAL